ASDLLQKGIHAQEAEGDLDVAILIFRQVVSSATSTNKAVAAQAQYQLVLCMLQKGDRAAATRELESLQRNFSHMPDLIARARKLIPESSALLPIPWGDNDAEQLNIKRDGVATGEYLYYSADAWTSTLGEASLQLERRNSPNDPYLQAVVLQWALK